MSNYQKFTEYLEKMGSSKSTIRNYEMALKKAESEQIINSSLNKIAMKKILNLKISTSSKIIMRSAIKKYAKFLVIQENLSAIPAEIESLDLPKNIRTIPRITKSYTVKNLLKICNNNEIKLIISILATTGCRISSLVDLKIEDIVGNTILFRTAKGNKPYKSMLTEETKILLNNHIKTRGSGYIFINSLGNKHTTNSIRNKLKRNLKYNYVNPHSFRHGIATELLENGADLYDVSLFLNHTSVTTTENYIHLTDEYINNKISKNHPLCHSVK